MDPLASYRPALPNNTGEPENARTEQGLSGASPPHHASSAFAACQQAQEELFSGCEELSASPRDDGSGLLLAKASWAGAGRASPCGPNAEGGGGSALYCHGPNSHHQPWAPTGSQPLRHSHSLSGPLYPATSPRQPSSGPPTASGQAPPAPLPTSLSLPCGAGPHFPTHGGTPPPSAPCSLKTSLSCASPRNKMALTRAASSPLKVQVSTPTKVVGNHSRQMDRSKLLSGVTNLHQLREAVAADVKLPAREKQDLLALIENTLSAQQPLPPEGSISKTPSATPLTGSGGPTPELPASAAMTSNSPPISGSAAFSPGPVESCTASCNAASAPAQYQEAATPPSDDFYAVQEPVQRTQSSGFFSKHEAMMAYASHMDPAVGLPARPASGHHLQVPVSGTAGLSGRSHKLTSDGGSQSSSAPEQGSHLRTSGTYNRVSMPYAGADGDVHAPPPYPYHHPGDAAPPPPHMPGYSHHAAAYKDMPPAPPAAGYYAPPAHPHTTRSMLAGSWHDARAPPAYVHARGHPYHYGPPPPGRPYYGYPPGHMHRPHAPAHSRYAPHPSAAHAADAPPPMPAGVPVPHHPGYPEVPPPYLATHHQWSSPPRGGRVSRPGSSADMSMGMTPGRENAMMQQQQQECQQAQQQHPPQPAAMPDSSMMDLQMVGDHADVDGNIFDDLLNGDLLAAF